MPITPSYLELCVKLYIGQENLIKHLPCKYVTSDLRLYSVYIDCQCCYSVCKPDIDLVLVVHPVERPARAYRNTSRAPRGRCLDPHVQVFLLDEHLGQGRYPIRINRYEQIFSSVNGRMYSPPYHSHGSVLLRLVGERRYENGTTSTTIQFCNNFSTNFQFTSVNIFF